MNEWKGRLSLQTKRNPLTDMSAEQLFLVEQSMLMMDRNYDEAEKLVRDEEEGGRLSTRSSAHYALGLMLRDRPGDRERACAVARRVLDMQLDAPDEIYDGTFKVFPGAPTPPAGHMAWGVFPPGIAYSMPTSMAALFERFAANVDRAFPGAFGGEGAHAVRSCFVEAANGIWPPVWQSYDPNWREFIACSFALLLEHFEDRLPVELTERIDDAMAKAVAASISRRLSQSIPMNTNIELMHAFIVHYYGHRYRNADWIGHSEAEARRLLASYSEFDSFAEFNSATYYGVDLTVLGMWRKYARTSLFRYIGGILESGLWRNIAMFYHPGLENMAGPYSRGYEMEMGKHSSMGVFVYLALGQGYEHLAAPNCETSHDPIIALVGADVPEDVVPQLREHRRDRLVSRLFRELCERDKPGVNTNLCKAEAWIGKELMIGALSGSRNTSGQLHPATIHWQDGDGVRRSLRLLRRAKGEPWKKHMRGVVFDCSAGEGMLEAEVSIDSNDEIDIFFEADGPGVELSVISDKRWALPGLTCLVSAEAPPPVARRNGDRLEIVYSHRPGEAAKRRMTFKLRLKLQRGSSAAHGAGQDIPSP